MPLESEAVATIDGPLTIGALRAALANRHAPYLVHARAGLALPMAWERRLAAACRADPRLGAVSPLNNALDLLSIDRAARVDEAMLIDRRVHALGAHRHHQMPLFWPDCVCFARAALERVAVALAAAPADARDWNWLCGILNGAGFAVAVCDHIYVHDPDLPRGRRNQARHADAEIVDAVHPLAPLRHHLRDARARGLDYADTLPPRPTQLHITHSWGGGLGRWVDDYVAADTERNNLILRSIGNTGTYGERLDLCNRYDALIPLRSWVLHYPIRNTALVHLQYISILDELIREFAVQGILISSLIGHSLDALRTGLPTVHVLHDYYPYCPALNICFDQPCQDCGAARLESCFARNPFNRLFNPATAQDWLHLRERYFSLVRSEGIRFAVPTPSVKEHLLQLAPVLESVPFTLIPHGIDWEMPTPRSAPQTEDPPSAQPAPPLHILVLGRLTHAKGQGLLESLLPTIHRIGSLSLLGCGKVDPPFADDPRIRIVPQYSIADLPRHLEQIAPDLALLLSTVPETFSYTLSELKAAGIPVLATDLGGHGDRIQDGVSGFLSPPNPEALRERLLQLNAQRALLSDVRRHLSARTALSLPEMIVAYHELLPMDPYAPSCYLHPGGSRSRPVDPETANPNLKLFVNKDLTYSQALGEFLCYTRGKILASPRLPGWLKRPFRAGS